MVNRIIACLDVLGSSVYKGINFSNMKPIGDIYNIAYRYYLDYVDEIVILNIGKSDITSFLGILRKLSRNIYIPITFGGNIKTPSDVELLLNNGVDRICLNSTLYYNNEILPYLSKRYGSQCIIGSIDVSNILGSWYVYIDGGRKRTNILLSDWIRFIESKGIGEILLTSIDKDGTGSGYDIDLMNYALGISNVPIIASGGVGCFNDIELLFRLTNVKSALIASYLHSGLDSIYNIKRRLSSNYYVRK
ncbi:imidazole glycerol phosphate synthase cyclase subunit [Candidatus Vidania fulgoroideorum]